ncbi:PDZ domain-containing protein [Methylophilus aquaticus]|uniref:PDZ domain-containing protein n=2 Tax=Methylophilus aquaticus TaxID=1971610 RepID=A0ABT9JQV8_9PROT|nr:PDZ domain-containing protein [Methylophilus aquaticus]
MIATCLTSAILHAEDNPYTTNYQSQNQGNLRSMQSEPIPQLFSGKNRDDDNISMLENGFDLMGFSNFESEEVSPDLALAHGKVIQSDAILVYVKKAPNASPSARMEVIKEAAKKGKALTEKDVAAPGKFRYYASYWAKLPAPVLGVHVIKLVPRNALDEDEKTEAKTDAEGVRLIAVIHDSAAEKAGLQRGDQLLTINREKVEDAAGLSSLVRRYRGNAVSLQIKRRGEPMQLDVQL